MLLYFVLFFLAALVGLILWQQLLQRRCGSAALFHVVCLQGDTAAVEQQIRLCLKRQRNHTYDGILLFVDRDLSPESVLAAQILLSRETEAILCSAEQAKEYISWEIDQFGARTD